MQWFKLEHCCHWQDCDPVWPELSECPALASLWYAPLYAVLIDRVFIDLQENTNLQQLESGNKQDLENSRKREIHFSKKRNVKTPKSYSDTLTPFKWNNFELLLQLPHKSFWIFFLRNVCGCCWCMPGWTVFADLWTKRKSAFDICSTEENSSHQGKYMICNLW